MKTALAVLSALALAHGPAVAAVEEVPVILAVDSSRSLSPAENERVRALAAGLARELPGGRRSALLAFDDEVRWLVEPGRGAGAAALGDALSEATPRGRVTVLHDALVRAVQALPGGGVVVLFSDGKDEESATTLEDVARLAAAQSVQVVAVAAGRADERALNRLAILTGGTAFPRRSEPTGAALAAEAERLAAALDAARRAAAPALPAPTPAPAATPPPVAPASESRGLWPLALLALALALATAAVGFFWARRRLAPAAIAVGQSEPCSRCGATLPADGSPCPRCQEEDVKLLVRGAPTASLNDLAEVSLDDTLGFLDLPIEEAIERTLVLAEEAVLIVFEPGCDPRTYRLPTERAVSIGRSVRCSLPFPDPTLSAEHFRLAYVEGGYVVVDQHSTNGLFLNGTRTGYARLRPGDRLRAGQEEFELRVRQRSVSR